MNRILLGKIVLAVVGLLTFGAGMRLDEPAVRWVGIGLLAVAFLLRFLPGGASRRR